MLGICNGFQVLLEAGLLPGALLRNDALEFRCQWVDMPVERADTPFTRAYRRGQVLRMPIAHGEGNYVRSTRASGRRFFRYCDRPAAYVGQPERLAGQHRRHVNAARQRPRPDAAPRARAEPVLGGADGRRALRVDRRGARCSA